MARSKSCFTNSLKNIPYITIQQPQPSTSFLDTLNMWHLSIQLNKFREFRIREFYVKNIARYSTTHLPFDNLQDTIAIIHREIGIIWAGICVQPKYMGVWQNALGTEFHKRIKNVNGQYLVIKHVSQKSLDDYWTEVKPVWNNMEYHLGELNVYHRSGEFIGHFKNIIEMRKFLRHDIVVRNCYEI